MAAMNRMVVEIFDKATPLHMKYRGELAVILRACAVYTRMAEFSGVDTPMDTVKVTKPFLWS